MRAGIAPEALDYAILGGRRAEHRCVTREASLAGHVRTAFPHTLNLGFSGSGPLLEFARFIEYAAPLRPRLVVWNWYEGNDLQDLRRELLSTPLRRYLTAPTPFGLKARQAEIDRALRDHIDAPIRLLEKSETDWLVFERARLHRHPAAG